MTKREKILFFYLLIISTITMVLNFVILNKKIPQLSKTTPVQTEKTVINPDLNVETKLASDCAKLTTELAGIRNELSMIRATQRDQNQTLGATDIEDLLEENNLPTPTLELLTLKTSTAADIHQEKSASSTVIGHIYFGENYPYFQKQGNWYLIKTESVQGWINASLVKEIK